MTDFAITPVDPRGLTNLADGLDGFQDDTTFLQATQQTTLFVTAPTTESNGRCLYFLTDDGSKAFVPNTIVNVWITDLSVRTVTYNDPNLEAQDKLLVQFVTPSGEYWTIRTGLLSWAASSLLLGLSQLKTEQLVEQLCIRVSNKGRAVFLNVCLPDGNGGWQRVEVPRDKLHKLEYDECLDSITAINQTAQSISQPEPALPAAEPFVEDEQVEELAAEDKLDDLLNEIQQPKRRRRKSFAKEQMPA
jgi:hypothetical protein